MDGFRCSKILSILFLQCTWQCTWISPIWAEDIPPGITGINPITISALNAFNLSSTVNPDFGKCTNVQVSLNNLGRLAGGGLSCSSSVAPDGNCQGEDIVARGAQEAECNNFLGTDGKFSKSVLEKFIKTKLDPSLCFVGCKRSQVDSLRTEIGCIEGQNSILSQKVQSLQGDFQKVLTTGKQEIGKFNQVINGRQEQIKFVVDKQNEVVRAQTQIAAFLGGVSGNGQQNASSTTRISQFETAFRALRQQKDNFEFRKKSNIMFSTISCFNTEVKSGFTCEINGESKRATDYVACLYRDSFKKNKSGTYEKDNPSIEKRAEENRKLLLGFLTEAFSRTPSVLIDNAKDGEKVDPSGLPTLNSGITSNTAILTLDRFIERYGARLNTYKRDFFNPQREIIDRLRACENRSKSELQTQLVEPSSSYNQELIQITESERKTADKVKDFVTEASGLITSGYFALTTQHFPINTDRCFYVDPVKQMSCMKDLDNNLRGLVQGTTPQSNFTVQIPSAVPGLAFNAKCNGLNGCIIKYNGLAKGLEIEKGKYVGQKKTRIQFYNGTIDGFTTQVKDRLRFDTSALKQRIDLANDRLSKIKGAPIRSKTVEQKKIEMEDAGDDLTDFGGLYKMPENILSLIGEGILDPDPSDDNFRDAKDSLNAQDEQFGTRLSELTTSREKFKNKLVSCPAEQAEKKLNRLEPGVNKLVSQCNQLCNDRVKNKLSEVAGVFQGIDSDVAGSIASSLETGADNCGVGDENQVADSELEKLADEVLHLSRFQGVRNDCLDALEAREKLAKKVGGPSPAANVRPGGNQPGGNIEEENKAFTAKNEKCENEKKEFLKDQEAQKVVSRLGFKVQDLGASPAKGGGKADVDRRIETAIKKKTRDIERKEKIRDDQAANRFSKGQNQLSPDSCISQAENYEKQGERISNSLEDGGSSVTGRDR